MTRPEDIWGHRPQAAKLLQSGCRCDPVQNGLGRCDLGSVGQSGSVDHDDRNTQGAGRVDLGLSPLPARVLTDNRVDAMFPKQRRIARDLKRPARDDHPMFAQCGGLFGHIDQTQHIVVLRLHGKGVHMQAPQRQHHASGRPVERGNRAFNIGHMLPRVTLLRLPRRAGQRDQRRPGFLAGGMCIPAHLGCKRMRGINDMADVMVPNVAHQTFNTAKPAFAGRHRLRPWRGNPTGIAKDCRQATTCNKLGKRAGLGRAAKNEEVRLHV